MTADPLAVARAALDEIAAPDRHTYLAIKQIAREALASLDALAAQPEGEKGSSEDVALVRKVLNWAWDAADENADREWITQAMDAFGRIAQANRKEG